MKGIPSKCEYCARLFQRSRFGGYVCAACVEAQMAVKLPVASTLLDMTTREFHSHIIGKKVDKGVRIHRGANRGWGRTKRNRGLA